MGWAFLPPLQRTLAEPIGAVTRPETFPAELPAWRSPAFTGTLSHAVVGSAPAGVVDGDGGGLGVPTVAASSVEMTLLPPPRPVSVQRVAGTMARTGSRPTVQRGAAPAAPAGAVEPVGSVEPVEEPQLGPPERPTDGPSVADAAPLLPVTATVAADELAPSLTTAPAAGMPLVHRAVVPDPAPPAAGPEPGPGPEPDRPTAAPLPPVVSTTLAGPARPRTMQRSVGTPLAPDRTHPPAGRTRLGLGPPLPTVPVSAVDEPSPDAPPVADQPPGSDGFTEVPVQRSVAGPAVELPLAPAVAPVDPADPGDTADAADGADQRDDAAPGEVGVPDAGPRAGAPLLGDRVPVQRSASADATTTPPPSTPTPAAGPTAAPLTAPPAGPRAVPPPAAVGSQQQDPGHLEHLDHLDRVEPPAQAAHHEHPAPPETSGPAEEPVVAEPAEAVLPSAPLPLSSGPPTSIQRSSVLPGPGVPRPSLVVRPASSVPAQRPTERVVRVQRVGADEPLNPPPAPPGRSTGPTPPPVVSRFAGLPSLPSGVSDLAPTRERLAALPPRAPSGIGDLLSQATPAVEDVATGATDRLADRAPQVPLVPPGLPPAVPSGLPPAVPSGLAPRLPGSLPLPTLPAMPGMSPATPAADAAAAPPATPSTASTPAAVPPGSSTPVPADAAPAVAAPGGAAPAAEQAGDVEAMAQKVFPAVLRRIKAELLIDRERRGTRTDPW